jgi:hypothetical protein
VLLVLILSFIHMNNSYLSAVFQGSLLLLFGRFVMLLLVVFAVTWRRVSI